MRAFGYSAYTRFKYNKTYQPIKNLKNNTLTFSESDVCSSVEITNGNLNIVKICTVYSFSLFFLLCLFGESEARTPKLNPAFGGKENQISAYFGVSVRNELEELFLAGVQYSQPNEFFRISGRRCIELMTAHGIGELSRYNQPLIFGLAQDVIFRLFGTVYTGINLGIYIKSNRTDRICSRFMFGEKMFLGFGFLENYRLELYGRHFSNGTLTENNSGQNFFGLSVMTNF